MQSLIEHARTFPKTIADQQEEFERLTRGQKPQALFISCSDSRVIPSLFTGARPGDIFELRTAGNIVPRYRPHAACGVAGSLEFALQALQVPDIIVCGHSHCGAVQGLMREQAVQLMPLLRRCPQPSTALPRTSRGRPRASARTPPPSPSSTSWFAALLPGALGIIPTAALAGVLIHAGFKLLPVRELGPLWRDHRGEAVVLVFTAGAILVTNMFEGVLIGLLLAVVKAAWETSHVNIDVDDNGTGAVRVRIRGHATFLRLPHILDALEQLPAHRPIELNLAGLRHLGHACMSALQNWADQHNAHTVQPERTRASA
jgi:hypothetical protein